MRVLTILACCLLSFTMVGSGDAKGEEYWPSPPGMTKLSKREYAPREGLAPFGSRDVPRRLPRKSDAMLTYVVQHSGGESTVEILFSRDVNRARFSVSGTGEAVPVSVRLSPSKQGFAIYSKRGHRRLDLSRIYKINGQVYRKSNRKSVVDLTHEVLQQTFCLGGTVSENNSMGDFVNFYGRRSKAKSREGMGVLPGVVVHYRCSRWRAN